jgi:hypothetical protein
MPTAKDLTGLGLPATQSTSLGFSPPVAVTAAGTASTDATVLKTSQNSVLMTGTTNDGIRLPTGMPLMTPYVLVAVSGATKVYPPTGAAFNGGSTDAALSVAANKCAICYRHSTTGCSFNLSA